MSKYGAESCPNTPTTRQNQIDVAFVLFKTTNIRLHSAARKKDGYLQHQCVARGALFLCNAAKKKYIYIKKDQEYPVRELNPKPTLLHINTLNLADCVWVFSSNILQDADSVPALSGESETGSGERGVGSALMGLRSVSHVGCCAGVCWDLCFLFVLKVI